MIYLAHHGVKGQKWGVRRYQNPDGTLTDEGKKQLYYRNRVIRNKKTTADANEIVNSLSKKEKQLLGANENEDWIPKEKENEISSTIAKRFVSKLGNTPISMLEIYDDTGHGAQVAVATKNDKQYRGKGYASENVQKAIKWMNSYNNKTVSELFWIAEKSNISSQKLAERNGFKELSGTDRPYQNNDFKYYSYKKETNGTN